MVNVLGHGHEREYGTETQILKLKIRIAIVALSWYVIEKYNPDLLEQIRIANPGCVFIGKSKRALEGRNAIQIQE